MSHILPAEGQIAAAEARPLDPDSPDMIGQFVDVRIDEARPNSLFGTLLNN